MKYISQIIRSHTWKTFCLIAFTLFGVMASLNSDAQSIVGKWKGVSVSNYYSDEYAKQIGKPMEEKLAKDGANSEIDYHADHSFTLIFYTSEKSEATIMKGVWAVSGDQLTLTLNPEFNPKKTSTVANFTIHDNMMVTTAVIAPPARIIKTVSTSSRL
jgi:hypothetical protein